MLYCYIFGVSPLDTTNFLVLGTSLLNIHILGVHSTN